MDFVLWPFLALHTWVSPFMCPESLTDGLFSQTGFAYALNLQEFLEILAKWTPPPISHAHMFFSQRMWRGQGKGEFIKCVSAKHPFRLVVFSRELGKTKWKPRCQLREQVICISTLQHPLCMCMRVALPGFMFPLKLP